MRRPFDPYRALAAAGVEVTADTLEPDLLGYYDDDRRQVTVARGLSQVERRCTAAHEYVHAIRRDWPTCSEWHEGKQERAVARVAARLLIPVEDLARALAWSQDLAELAEELWVDVDTLVDRLLGLDRRERRYLTARLGRAGGAACGGHSPGASVGRSRGGRAARS